MSKPFLKELNQPIIRRYIWAAVTCYAIIIATINISELRYFISNPEELDGAWRSVVPLVSAGLYLFLIRLVPTEFKEVLVFWRLRERLPGHRAFSVLAKSEPRVSTRKLKQLHGSLPRKGENQNKLWYSIYRTHKDADEVRDPHKSYLLYRELTYINLAVGILLLLPSIIVGLMPIKLGFGLIGVVILASIFLSLNAQSSAKRMVQNVLALESAVGV